MSGTSGAALVRGRRRLNFGSRPSPQPSHLNLVTSTSIRQQLAGGGSPTLTPFTPVTPTLVPRGSPCTPRLPRLRSLPTPCLLAPPWSRRAPDLPALVALGAEVETTCALADAALATRASLEAENVFFRETGSRKKLFDKVNAARKQTHGELAKMPHEKLGLPSTFANLFFRHLSSGDDDEEMTAEMIDEDIAALEEQIADKKALREALLAELAKKAQAQAAKAAEQAAVAELEKAAVEAARKLAEAKAKLAALQA